MIDAAGGSSEFAESVETLLVSMFPGDAEKGLSTPLALEDPIFNQPGNVIDRITYRSFARSRLGSALKSPRIFGIKHDGRVVVYYSPLDLSGGLVGEPIDGICGYSPHSATELMRNIVLQSATRSASATNSYEIGGLESRGCVGIVQDYGVEIDRRPTSANYRRSIQLLKRRPALRH